jgi:hypothetical protein
MWERIYKPNKPQCDMSWCPNLLPMLAIQGYQHSLASNITLLKALDLIRIRPIDLVIF